MNEVRSHDEEKSSPEICQTECSLEVVKKRLSSHGLHSGRLEKVVDLFFILSDPSRLRILLAMEGGSEFCVCDVASLLGVSVSAASHHLRKMKDFGILSNRSEGKLVYYSVIDTRVARTIRAAMS